MLDVWGVISNGLWVVGLSILLATWSWARYAAHEARMKTREKLNEPKYVLALDLGLLLFISGMALTEDRWWARVLWIALGIVVIVHAAMNAAREGQHGARS